MAPKTSRAFDCVEFKRYAQARLVEEFEARRAEFRTFGEFVAAKSREDGVVCRVWERFSGKRPQGA